MNNSKNMLNISPSKNIQKNVRYNRALSRTNKSIQDISKSNFLNTTNKFERALSNLREGLAELSNEYLDKEHLLNNYNSYCNYNCNNIPVEKKYYSPNKFQYLRTRTPKRDLNLIKNNLEYSNISKIPSSSFLNSTNDYSVITSKSRINQLYHQGPQTTIKSPKTEYYNDIKNIDKIYKINIKDISKPKEIIMLNNILRKQNKEFKEKIGKMRNKINELLNNLKMVRMKNQRLNNDKKN